MTAFKVFAPVASSVASSVDSLFIFMLLLCATVTLGIFAAIWYFAIRYRRGSSASRAGVEQRNLGIELTWTLLPAAMFVGLFIWSIHLYAQIETPPADARPIYVVAKQWMWKIQHVGGQREINELHVPLGRDVRLIMSSEDVIHSFSVPAFRVKQDVLPARTTELWFKATRVGVYHLFCMEYCGADHSTMGGRVIVMKPTDYGQWLSSHAPALDLAAQGAKLFREHGCRGCHEPGSVVHAPQLEGLYGKTVMLQGGEHVTADETYFRDSVLLPQKQIAAGYPPAMPSFAGQISEEDLAKLSAWFRASANEGSHTP